MKSILQSVAIIAVFAAALTFPASAADEVESFEVEQVGPRAYRARGSFVVASPANVAWEAIADYEGIPRIAPDVKISRIVSRAGDKVLVEQEAVASVLFFSKTIRLLLHIVETPHSEITFRDLGGDDFKSYVGFWKLEETAEGLRVSYGLDVERGFAAPDFLARPFFRKQAESLMHTMREEIVRRAAAGSQ